MLHVTHTNKMTSLWIALLLTLVGCSRTTLSDQLHPNGNSVSGVLGGSSALGTGSVINMGGGIAGNVGGYVGGDVVSGSLGGDDATGGYLAAGGIWATGGTVAGSTPNGGIPWFLTGGAQMTGGVVSSGGSQALDILNPHGCATRSPFVLTIQPSGDQGSVSGWLESAPSVAFEQQLPRFAIGLLDTGDISTWWSIATWDSNGGGTLYFYGGLDVGSPIEIAVAEGAKDFSDINRSSLMFAQDGTRPMNVGEIAVVYNPDNGASFAIRADALYIANTGTDPNEPVDCTAIDASWTFTF